MSGNCIQGQSLCWRAPGGYARGRAIRALWVVGALALFCLAASPVGAGQLDFITRTFYDNRTYTGIYLADMTNDGVVDVLAGNRTEHSLEILHLDRDSNYLQKIDSLEFTNDVHDAKAADLDKDGDMDLVVGVRYDGLRVVENTGGPGVVGSWEVTTLDRRYSWQVLVADLDGDGNLDIADGVDHGPIVTFYGDGQGGFTPGAPIAPVGTAMLVPLGFNFFDHNGDGRPDLIGVDGAYLRVFVNPGNRASAWASLANNLIGDPTARPRQAAALVSPSAADLNGDGHIDQVVFVGTPEEASSTDILILEGNGTTWTPRRLDTLSRSSFVGHAGVADVNGDGHLDIHVGGGFRFNGLRVYLGDGAGNFRREDIPLGYGLGGLNGFASGDVNGDGHSEMVASRYKTGGQSDGGLVLMQADTQRRASSFWTGECVECEAEIHVGSIIPGSLKIDRQGAPHVVIGGGDLFYLWRSGQTWRRELVQLGLGRGINNASLALDAAGQPHISYRTGVDGALRYAYRTAAGWQIETIEIDPYAGSSGNTSLALDAEGRPHIAYEAVIDDYDGTMAVRYAFKDESEWITEAAASEGGLPSLALAGDGTPHLSFVAGEQLYYAVRSATQGWDIIPVGSETAENSSLALDSAGRARIAYAQGGAIKLATYSPPDWDVAIVVPEGDYVRPELVIGPADALHVVFFDRANSQMRHAYRSGGTWHNSLVATPDINYGQFALAVGPAGKPQAVYLDGQMFAALKHTQASGPAGGWSWGNGEVILRQGYLSGFSLALDPDSQPALSYCDLRTNAVVYAHRTTAGWARQVVDDLSGICVETALALDGAGKAHVAYLVGDEEGNVTKLIYARQQSAGWGQEIIEASPSQGGLALAVDASARPHLIYGHREAGKTNLQYATRATTGWQRAPLMTDVGESFTPQIKLDSQGRPHIVFRDFDASATVVRYGYRDAAGWQLQPVKSSAELLWRPQLALGSDDTPHVVYTSETNEEWITAHYARRDPNGWQTEAVRRWAYSEMGPYEATLALGPDNRPLVVINDPYYGRLFLGTRGQGGWAWERLDAAFWNGLEVVIDATGNIHLVGSYDQLAYLRTQTIDPALNPGRYLSAGEYHTCGLRPSGQAVCWGASRPGNDHGQAAGKPGPFTQVDTGALHSCGLRRDGGVTCWGSNSFGQATNRQGPFAQLSSGGDHNCALRADGRAVCWGRNTQGEAAGWAGPFVQVDAGWQVSCGLLATGNVICWGNNIYSQAVNQSGPFTQISVGLGHSCGLQPDGGVHCWGRNDFGQATDQAGPFVQISAGGAHTCGLKPDGGVVCWGLNSDGQAEDPAGPFVQVTAGGTWWRGDPPWGHTCAIRQDGDVQCWGSNDDGQAVGQSGPFGPFGPSIRLPIILRSR